MIPTQTTIGPGAKLRAARIAAGLTPADLAERLNCSLPWISRYERGKPLTLDKVHEIALAIGCDPHAIDARLASTHPGSK